MVPVNVHGGLMPDHMVAIATASITVASPTVATTTITVATSTVAVPSNIIAVPVLAATFLALTNGPIPIITAPIPLTTAPIPITTASTPISAPAFFCATITIGAPTPAIPASSITIAIAASCSRRGVFQRLCDASSAVSGRSKHDHL